MLHINRVTLLGYAGRDPDLRALPDGGRAASFSLATTEKWKDREGKPAQATAWHRIAVYGAAVDAVERMVRKGAAVLVEGRLAHCELRDRQGRERHGRERHGRDRDGRDREIAEIVVAGPRGIVNVLSPPAKEAAGDPASAKPGWLWAMWTGSAARAAGAAPSGREPGS